MMKFTAGLLPPLVALMLASCAGDVMQVMKEDKQPVGVLMVRPIPPQAGAGHVEFIGGVVTPVKDEVDPDAARTIGIYDNNAKTFRKYGQSVVAKLRAQGIDARLLDSYPSGGSLTKDRQMFGKVINYPAETKKYPRCLVIDEVTMLGVSGTSSIAATTFVNARLIDPATNVVLGQGTGYKVNPWQSFSSRAQAHAILDESSRAARQTLLEETFYLYEE